MKKLLLVLLALCWLNLVSYSQEKNKYADDIKVSNDKFDGSITWRSPNYGKGIAATSLEPVVFVKIKNNDEIKTFLNLTTYGETINIGKQGVIILFADGDKIEFPNEKIEVESILAGGTYLTYKYSAFIQLNEEQLEKFITKDLEDFRLYIYSSFISKKKRKAIKGWSLAIKEAN